MSDRALSGKERYRARFLAELDGRIEAILTSAATLREARLSAIPNDDSAQARALVDAVDHFAEVARVLRLSDEEIAAFGFPTAHRPSQPDRACDGTDHDTTEEHHDVASADDHARAAATPRTASHTQDLDPAIVQADALAEARVCADAPIVVEQVDDEPGPATRTEPDADV